MVKNAKAKVTRAIRKGLDITDELDLPKLESFQTRKEFNKWKEKQKAFTNRKNKIHKNEYGFAATDLRIAEQVKATKKAQRLHDKRMKEAMQKPVKTGGTQYQEMLKMGGRNAKQNRPKDFNFGEVRNKSRMKTLEEGMRQRGNPETFKERDKIMHENYIKLLRESLNNYADDLIDLLEAMPSSDFVELFKYDSRIFDFNMWYTDGEIDLGPEQYAGIVEEMEDYIESYRQGKLNPLFEFRPKRK